MLTTLLPPTGGGARVAGHDIVGEGPAVRAAIGAALQEAALDPHLTAREHMRLQTALHGLPREERVARGDALIERVGLSDAADRKVGGYSGGMKRRLDLALALVHGPRVLFLDEPTTGLDPQSRAALWDEVARLAGQEGVTVFLTTQYLEEADQLADRVGIIDDGKIVAEGTPAALKAEIGRPSLEVTPASRPRAIGSSGCSSASARGCRRHGTRSRYGSTAAPRGWPTSSGRSTPRGSGSPTSTSRAEPRRRLPREDRAPPRGRRRRRTGECRPARQSARGGDGVSGARGRPARRAQARLDPLDPGPTLAGRAVLRTLRQPAMIVPSLVFPLFLLAVNSAGLDAATQIPGFPTDSYLTFVLAVPFIQGALFATMNSGQALAEDIENGFFNRLALTPMRGSSLIAGQLGGLVVIGLVQATVYLARRPRRRRRLRGRHRSACRSSSRSRS